MLPGNVGGIEKRRISAFSGLESNQWEEGSEGDQRYHDLLSKLKSAMDREDILLPGRYDINSYNV